MLLLTVIYSCANIGSPNGGPYDETPPKFVSSTPVPNQINYTGKKIEILFDELIQIEKPSENVIITPPQMELPVIRSAGKKAVIELKDTLKPNTTYTIDFTNSISDNNEKNVFENFSFAFSTACSMAVTVAFAGCFSFRRSTACWKRSRSSARSIASGLVPITGTPAASSARASFSGV